MTLDEACKLANAKFKEFGYLNGFDQVVESDKRWIFLGLRDESGMTDFSNVPVCVDKQTGELKNFPFSILDNYDEYWDGELLDVPEEYIIR